MLYEGDLILPGMIPISDFFQMETGEALHESIREIQAENRQPFYAIFYANYIFKVDIH